MGGEESFSTIYAPSQVKRNQPFLVNIFFHKDEESGAVELLAQRLDPKTSLVDTQNILFKEPKTNLHIKPKGLEAKSSQAPAYAVSG